MDYNLQRVQWMHTVHNAMWYGISVQGYEVLAKNIDIAFVCLYKY